MAKLNKILAIASTAAALGVTVAIYAQQTTLRGGSNAKATAPKVTDAVLKRAGTPNDPLAGSWLTYGGSQSERRYSTLKQIDPSNAKRLGLAYTYTVGAGGSNQEGTPLVWNNILFGITTWSRVFAVQANTGEELWTWDPEQNQQTVRPKICCGIVNRGIALYNGMIIAPSNDGRLFALDALTGKPVWETRAVYSQDDFTLTMAPRIAGGKVIIGAAGGDRPTRGRFMAFDAQTGKHAWTFYTVPGDPSKPFENEAMRVAAKTWGGDFFKRGGGGAVWDGFAYDPELNLVYVGTGNAEPWVQKFRGAQNVDNLYTCSILAVDLTTGQLKWYFQPVPNDNWDFDNVQQLMLLDLNINGKMRKVITQASKNGFFWVLDRATGQYISGGPFVRISWALRLDEKGRPVVNPEAYYDKEPISIYPTGGGGHNWAPMSFNPATGLVYIPASYTSFPYQADDDLKPGSTGYVRPPGETKEIKPIWGPDPPAGARQGLTAYDPINQKVKWSVEGGGGIGGGTVSTASNMIFQTINDGRFRALTADKGEILYEVQVGRTGMAPPITYESNGTQYVAFIGGLGRPANTNGPNDAKVDNPPLLYVFKLDGNATMPTPAPPPANNNKQQDKGKGKGGPAPLPPAGPAPEQQN